MESEKPRERKKELDFLDVDDGAAKSFAELDDAIDEGENGVIAAKANVLARLELCALLTDQNFTSFNGLTTKTLDAESLARSLMVLSGATTRFNVCHKSCILTHRRFFG